MTAKQIYYSWYSSLRTDFAKDVVTHLFIKISKFIKKKNNLSEKDDEFWINLTKLSRKWFKSAEVDVMRWHFGRGKIKREIQQKMIFIDKIFEHEGDDYLCISGLAGLFGKCDNTQEKIELEEKYQYLYNLILEDNKNPFQKRNPQIKIKVIEMLRENTPRKEIAQSLNISESLITHTLRRAQKIVTAIKNLP